MTCPVRLPDLPVLGVLPAVAAALEANRSVVLHAPPASGKTTLVPLALLAAPWLAGRRILLLEPRRLAARAAAHRMASLLDEEVGRRIGYHIRLDRRVSAGTRVEILTEGMLVQRLLHDPELPDAGIVIFDEFHERSLSADQGLALALDVRRSLRPDLRLMVMSATIDPVPLSRHLGDASVLSAEARVWPVETRLLDRMPAAPTPRLAADAAIRALAKHDGSLLVFLPGESEIIRTANMLRDAGLPDYITVHPLFAALPRERQDAAVQPPSTGRRKIVLATSIAESSLTIEGISVVIDAGWMRVPRYSPRTGMSRLETLRVTRDRADQRRGRAGRVGPGICYRLWDEATDRQMLPEATPEILDADLSGLVLQCADWGIKEREALPWLTLPPDASWRQAVSLLRELEAIDENDRITPRGRNMARMPIHPRLSHMVLMAADAGSGRRGCLLAAAMSERSGEARLRHENDARRLLDGLDPGAAGIRTGALASEPAAADVQAWRHRVHRLAGEWGRNLASHDSTSIDIGRMLAWAFPDRIARKRDAQGRFLMVNGRGASLDTADPLASEEWLVAVELQDDAADARIFLAAPVARNDVEADFTARMVSSPLISWDRRTQSVQAVCRLQLGAIILRDSVLKHPDAGLVRLALLDGIRHLGTGALNWSPAARALQARVLFLRRARPEEGWPDLSDAALQADIDTWLSSFLDGLTRWEQVQKINLSEALMRMIGPRRRMLDELAPSHISLPNGSRVLVKYDEGDAPVVEVRIQAAFGLSATPRVAGGRVPVLVRLLSPAQRPVQVTADLESFWNQGYARIRKELRGRYPKHAWPEDPRQATR